MKVKIAVVQFAVRRHSFEKNMERAEKFIKRAAVEKSDIIVFPEDFLTGTLGKEYVDDEKEARNFFQKLAKKYKIDIVPGSVVEKGIRDLKYNVTYYIDAKGRVKGEYRKIHLWLTERPYLSPGHKIEVFNTKYGRIGLIICWDLMFPEIFRKMAQKKVQIVICPSHWSYRDAGIGLKYDPHAEIKLIDSLCIERAFEEEIILVYCNSAGRDKIGKHMDVCIGHSQITVPFKGDIKKLDHNKEAMFIKDVNTKILKDAEKSYKIRKDLRRGIRI